MWSKIKQEEKDEHFQYLKERVSIQHELIKRQDLLFKKRQAQIEQKRWQVQYDSEYIGLETVEHSKNTTVYCTSQETQNSQDLVKYKK